MKRSHGWPVDRLEVARAQGDPNADEAVASVSVTEMGRCWTALREWRKNSEPVPTTLPPAVREFFKESATLPSWADTGKLDVACRLFARYPADLLAMLLYAALPECYAAPDGTSVLLRTRKMTASPGPRLFATARFVVDVMSADSVMPEGRGIRSAQKVRWMHAVVRRQVLAGGNWDTTKGVPVNQEHMAGTLIAFSHISIDALVKMGARITPSEHEAYLHAWAVVGHLLGIKGDYLPNTLSEARLLTETIRQRNHRPSEQGQRLMAELMRFAQSRFPPFARGLPPALVRYLIPDITADLLQVPTVGGSRHLVSTLRLGFLLRDRVTRILPFARAIDFYNTMAFVKAVLWLESRLMRT